MRMLTSFSVFPSLPITWTSTTPDSMKYMPSALEPCAGKTGMITKTNFLPFSPFSPSRYWTHLINTVTDSPRLTSTPASLPKLHENRETIRCHTTLPHLSKGKSALKQKCTQLLTPFCFKAFHALIDGVIHLLWSVSFKKHSNRSYWLLENFHPSESGSYLAKGHSTVTSQFNAHQYSGKLKTSISRTV